MKMKKVKNDIKSFNAQLVTAVSCVSKHDSLFEGILKLIKTWIYFIKCAWKDFEILSQNQLISFT